MKHQQPMLPPSHLVLTSLAVLLLSAGAAEAASRYGSNTANVSIPDNGGWVRSSISISGAPSNATVTGIDVHFSAVHPYSGDLDIDLNDSGITRNYDLWANEGGSADNPSRTTYGITTFNGLPVNGTWYLYAKDTASLDAGYIDEWWIRIYYTETTNTYAVYGKIDSLVYGSDEDGDGYYDTYDFRVCVDGDASPGPAEVHTRIVSVNTSQAWWSVNSWTVQGTTIDYHCFAFDETNFTGHVNGNTNLDFTVELWNANKSTRYATDTSVTGEPVRADQANSYAVYGIVDSLVYGVDQDADGYYETYDFRICVDGDASPGPATIYARIVSVTTSQAWWSLDPWSVSGTATDYHCFAFDETLFDGEVSGNTNLDFTVEIWNSAKTVKKATDTSVYGEPVKADHVDVIDTEGPKIGVGIGVLNDTKTHIDTYFEDRLIFADRYLLEDWSRRSSLNPHGHNGRMQSGAKIETRIFDTDWFIDDDKMEDANNVWDAPSQASGVDAHVYAARVYDYMNRQLGLNGPDNAGSSMNSVVEVTEYSNGDPCADQAISSITKVSYCVSGQNPSFAGDLDIVAHEWGHSLTHQIGAQPNDEGEPGALDEAFSDWLGAAVADYYNAGNPWVHGGDVVPGGNRNMQDPPLVTYMPPPGVTNIPFPDSYRGPGWWDTSDCTWDWCGRHINATVADKMFYLLSESGTHNYIQVGGLGVQTAIEIARDANLNHWNSSSNFAHARQGMLLAAAGYSSDAVAQVRNAWAAVHVGAPASDFFNRPHVLSGSSGVSRSSNRGATRETGEPNHAGYMARKSVWFTWTAPGTGAVSLDTHTSSFDTLLAVYTGASVGGLTEVASNDDDGSSGQASSVAFDSIADTTYRIVVDGYGGAEGDVVLNYSWAALPTLTGLSISGPSSVNESSTATYTAAASWSDGTTSQVSASWTENSAYASISPTGVLSTLSVTTDQSVSITAIYTVRGVTKTANKTVTIVNTTRTLTGLSITGPSSVNEQSSATYAAVASWDDGSTSNVAASWGENSPYVVISASGVLTTSSVTSNQSVTITATYSAGGVTKTASKTVIVTNVTSVLTGLSILGATAVNEQSSATYSAVASWDDGSASNVAASWSESSPYATISASGVLTTSSVTSDESATITATYSAGGVTKTANKTVTIIDVGPGGTVIFSDGFESGDLSAWSSQSGGL